MQICMNMSRLRHYQGRLMLFRGGGNVYNVMLHAHAATIRRLKSFILCLI